MSPAVLEPPAATDPAVVLLVEEEPILRSSIARGIGKLPNVEVLAAANYAEALALLDSRAPRVVVSDIDLPDGCGVDLADELSRRGVSAPMVIVTGRPDDYPGPIPAQSDIIVVEKPVRIGDLRSQVTELLGLSGAAAKSPFSVIDYVQLACLGGHSARIDVDAGEIVATVIVNGGALWSAADRLGSGSTAFHRISFRTDGVVSLSPLVGDPGPRNIHARWEIVMMDSARAFDDFCRDQPEAPPAAPPMPPPPEPAADFEEQWNAGVEALLRRDFRAALKAFRAADAVNPGVPKVVANLQRLREMDIRDEVEERTL